MFSKKKVSFFLDTFSPKEDLKNEQEHSILVIDNTLSHCLLGEQGLVSELD